MIAKPAVLDRLVLALSVLLLALFPLSLLAQQNEQLASANERINFSGKLSMLSQRSAAAGCNIGADVDGEENRQILSSTSAEFWSILDALQFGNTDLYIEGEETDDAILAALQETKTQWMAFEELINKLTNSDVSTTDTELIDAQNLKLQVSTQNLLDSVLTIYFDDSAAHSAFGKVIDIASQQRMLTQKMSKDACHIWSGQDSDEKVKALQSTMEFFENSMISLREGTDDLIKPPSSKIEQELDRVWQQWNVVKPQLQKALAKQTIDIEARLAVSNQLNQMLRELNLVVGLYTVAENEQGNITDDGATERVNFSGKLSMLSQRVAAAVCNLMAGVNTEQDRLILTDAQAEFAKITQALEFGDADLHIFGEEKRRKTLEVITKLNKEWEPINVAIDKILKGENIEDNAAIIYEQNMSLLEAANILASEITGEYSDPTLMMQSNAILINISGRQRMLTQKMLKESCLLWSGQHEMADELSGTIEMFDVSLQALRSGLESAGVKAAPTTEIAYGLDVVWKHWHVVKPALVKASSIEATDLEQRSYLLEELDAILAEMNAVVGMYTIYGKTGL